MNPYPLTHCTVLVTRPATQSQHLCALLHSVGATPLPFPLINIIADNEQLSTLSNKVAQADWLIFISPGAIDIAKNLLTKIPAHINLACVGEPSAKKLAQLYHDNIIVYPHEGNGAAALLQEPALAPPLSGQKIVIICGHGGRGELTDILSERGAHIVQAPVYQRIPNNPDWRAFDLACATSAHIAACITSEQIATLLFKQAGSERLARLQSLIYCVAHKRIAKRLTQFGARDILITDAGDQAMVTALCQRLIRP